MKTVALIEGFSGGPIHTKDFRRALMGAGFKVIKDSRRADIIVAHSAGIYNIAPDSQANLLLLIGPTYWPGQPLIKRLFRHTKTSRRHHVANFGWKYYIWKKILEVYYFFRRPSFMWLGIIHNNRLDRLKNLANRPGRRIIIIRNRSDPFSGPMLQKDLKIPKIRFVEIPGVHDDYVTNPKPYIDLLLQEL